MRMEKFLRKLRTKKNLFGGIGSGGWGWGPGGVRLKYLCKFKKKIEWGGVEGSGHGGQVGSWGSG